MRKESKENFFTQIRSNIEKHGYHVTIVTGGIVPRFAYTIGLIRKYGVELVFAGGTNFLGSDLTLIFEAALKAIIPDNLIEETRIKLERLGGFSFRKVDASWSKIMLLGVFDYSQIADFEAFQIVPEKDNCALEVPDMHSVYNSSSQPVWRWLTDTWNYPVPKNSIVATNVKALIGEPITEVMRWEEEEWEMFAGPGEEVSKEEMRVVTIATMIGIDPSLYSALLISIGKGIYREAGEEEWITWG